MTNWSVTLACLGWIALLVLPSLGVAVPAAAPSASDGFRTAIDGGFAALPLLAGWLAGFVALCGRAWIARQHLEREPAGRHAVRRPT